MKFMLIIRATAEADKLSYGKADVERFINAMGAYNESLMEAGVLLAGDGLADDMSDSFVVDFAAETPVVTDGPYGQIHELFSGFWIIQAAGKQEAVEWALRCPLAPGSKLEVRRATDETDFADFADNHYLGGEEGWREELGRR